MMKEQAGDYVSISTNEGEIKGVLLESYEQDVTLIKLDSGYNRGIPKDDIKGIRVLKRAEKGGEGAERKQDTGLPGVSLIVTGGTISSRLDYKTGGVKWIMGPAELFSIAPKMLETVKINSIEKPFMLASENMTAREWQIIAKRAAELLNKTENRGVIITHGTDTLHYTAAALSFMLKNVNKPVVLTYAQRSTDRGSSDTTLNLTCAAHAAVSNIAEVMLVGHGSMNDEYCLALRGSKVRKMHTSRRDTFRPINCLPIAKIYENGRIEAGEHFNKRDENKRVEADTSFEEKTALIKYYPGAKPDILEFLTKQGYKGVVIEATGLGHVATEESRNNWLPAIKNAIKAGMTVCFAPQTLYGRLDPYVYSPGRKLLKAGVILLEDMLPETAYVKLGYVLAHRNWKDKIKEKMLENMSGEINKRIGPETFLY